MSDTVDIKDPHVTMIQNEANGDQEYQEMVQDISFGKKAKYMYERSKLKKIEGELKKNFQFMIQKMEHW